MNSKSLITLFLGVQLTGCVYVDGGSRYAATVSDYARTAAQVQIGMSPAQVSGILEPTQSRLRALDRRPEERYLEDGAEVLVRYYRSGWQEDGRLTDNEYTPYRFEDEQLVSIGWLALQRASR